MLAKHQNIIHLSLAISNKTANCLNVYLYRSVIIVLVNTEVIVVINDLVVFINKAPLLQKLLTFLHFQCILKNGGCLLNDIQTLHDKYGTIKMTAISTKVSVFLLAIIHW